MEENTVMTQPPVEVVSIQFRPGQKIYYFAPNGHTCQPGDHVIIDTARGPEFGICSNGNHKISAREVVTPLRNVLRKATAQDERIAEENRIREKQALELCMKKVEQMKLDMQPVGAECAFDGSKILIFFTADERVDFRELVKSLASQFHTRIELRQIGVRDKAKMVGGLGICGRPFCCASFLEDFQPVSIKMAKTQNLSLNPTKISGTCGRLMCCLKYEQDAYEDLIRNSPKVESFVDTPDGRGTVVELDLLRQRVKVRFEDRPEAVGSFRNDEIAVLRSGKAKKNDPPIPADLAPISGGASRRRLQKDLEAEAPALESIRLRYSEEAIAEEVPVMEEKPAEEASKGGNRRRNRRGKGGKQEGQEAKSEKPRQEKNKDAADKNHPKRNAQKTPAKDGAAPKNPGKENAPKAGKAPNAPGKNASNTAANEALKNTANDEGAAKKRNRRGGYHHRRRPKGNNPPSAPNA